MAIVMMFVGLGLLRWIGDELEIAFVAAAPTAQPPAATGGSSCTAESGRNGADDRGCEQ